MRLAIVGNGPSAKDKGAEIDAHDFVVRINWFKLQGAENAGSKLSAWAWFGHQVHPRSQSTPDGDYEIWFTQQRHSGNAQQLFRAIDVAGHRRMRFVTNEDAAAITRCLGLMQPTSGILTVAMALALKPEEISLYGYDATVPTVAGWDDAGKGRPGCGPWNVDCMHDHAREKRMLLMLRDAGIWCDRAVKVKINWPGPMVNP